MKKLLKHWWTPAKDTNEAMQRFRALSAASALIAVFIFAAWVMLPLWTPAELLSHTENMFLLFAALFAILAAGFLGAIALIKHGLY